MSDKIANLGNDTFKPAIAAATTPLLVDFWAPWCAPCKAIGPVLEEFATELAGKVAIAKVNVDESDALAAEQGIRSIPTLLLFKDGKIVYQTVGAQEILGDKAKFKEKLLSFA